MPITRADRTRRQPIGNFNMFRSFENTTTESRCPARHSRVLETCRLLNRLRRISRAAVTVAAWDICVPADTRRRSQTIGKSQRNFGVISRGRNSTNSGNTTMMISRISIGTRMIPTSFRTFTT